MRAVSPRIQPHQVQIPTVERTPFVIALEGVAPSMSSRIAFASPQRPTALNPAASKALPALLSYEKSMTSGSDAKLKSVAA